MQGVSPMLVVTGGCPLQRTTLGNWLRAQGFALADAHNQQPARDAAQIGLFLCSEHNPAADLEALAAHHAGIPTIAILSCNCDRALAVARTHALPNVFCADDSPERLSFAIRTMLGGAHYRSPSFQAFLSREPAGDTTHGPPNRVLTPRELDVLRLLAQGYSKKKIAASLHLSVKTVDNHSTSIMSKLNIHNRVDLARYAIREGLATA